MDISSTGTIDTLTGSRDYNRIRSTAAATRGLNAGHTTEVNIKINPEASVPEGKWNRLMTGNVEFRSLYNADTASTSKMSPADIERGLGVIAVKTGWNDQEIADMLVARRNEKNLTRANQSSIEKMVGNARKQATQEKGLREVSDQFAGFFIGQFLKTMRSTVETSEFGHGGNEEKIWQDMMDDKLADSAAAGSAYGLSDMIYNSLARRSSLPAYERASLNTDYRIGNNANYNRKLYPAPGTISTMA